MSEPHEACINRRFFCEEYNIEENAIQQIFLGYGRISFEHLIEKRAHVQDPLVFAWVAGDLEIDYTGSFSHTSESRYWEIHFKCGNLHREDGPALVRVLSDGRFFEEWLLHGRYSREDGPVKRDISKDIWSRDGYVYTEVRYSTDTIDGVVTRRSVLSARIFERGIFRKSVRGEHVCPNYIDLKYRPEVPFEIRRDCEGSRMLWVSRVCVGGVEQ